MSSTDHGNNHGVLSVLNGTKPYWPTWYQRRWRRTQKGGLEAVMKAVAVRACLAKVKNPEPMFERVN